LINSHHLRVLAFLAGAGKEGLNWQEATMKNGRKIVNLCCRKILTLLTGMVRIL